MLQTLNHAIEAVDDVLGGVLVAGKKQVTGLDLPLATVLGLLQQTIGPTLNLKIRLGNLLAITSQLVKVRLGGVHTLAISLGDLEFIVHEEIDILVEGLLFGHLLTVILVVEILKFRTLHVSPCDGHHHRVLLVSLCTSLLRLDSKGQHRCQTNNQFLHLCLYFYILLFKKRRKYTHYPRKLQNI